MEMNLNQPRFEYQHKPRVCPVCKSKSVATILWGLPAYSEQLERDLELGKVVLGGCCVMVDCPRWQCADCDTQFYEKSMLIQESSR